jgi:hypothetical protein
MLVKLGDRPKPLRLFGQTNLMHTVIRALSWKDFRMGYFLLMVLELE